ncbi:hypothetical protein GDO86_004181 [Hymenochirus boettgeri]|uniref:Uncharacterized protein n=1 Tax=Hymenochirus boettgeri TaxID=247094 RepID=A0A8T2KCR6_9PIPI|nr:hypothetical protein GDO86_004181 [Hymenochirus boettgeri]
MCCNCMLLVKGKKIKKQKPIFFVYFLTDTGSFPRQSCKSLSISLTTSSASTVSRPKSRCECSSCSKTVSISLESRLTRECTSANA